MGVELTGKTLGIIGCGNIGCDRRRPRPRPEDEGASPSIPISPTSAPATSASRRSTLDELLARADFITLHTPLTDSTRNLIDAAALAKTKRGVRIINCARGGLVVEEDLEGRHRSPAMSPAPPSTSSPRSRPAPTPLFGMDQVVATPHLGAATAEAQEKVALQVAEQMADFLLTGAVTNALNMPSVSAEEAPKLQPYMNLAQQLG